MLSDDQQSFRDRRLRFGSAADAYHAFRPPYPDEAVDWALEPGNPVDRILDLAAGTGKLTGSLINRAAEVIAVEPDSAMLDVLHTTFPPVRALAGSAENIPLPDSSVDAVVVGQAFHWFDPLAAGREIARVLRPGGVLAALWNSEDARVDWVAGYHRAADSSGRVPGVPQGSERAELPRLGLFELAGRREFDYVRRLTVERLISELSTHSWALVSTETDREAVFEGIRRYFGSRADLVAQDGTLELPMRTLVARARRLG
ncbi:MAG TPA: class I SAM-dependent methyltransferase [Pseudonocardia sp.]|jgi:SAM-dependent methyltransferase|nr:class I SAM-dependent methyltransferase [Pseudonocardia sp.]